jgi:hypothetical protein
MRVPATLLVAVAALGFEPPALAAEVGTTQKEPGARKGTRLYVPDDPAKPAQAKQAESEVNTLEGCMQTWDRTTHISKSQWRDICQREIRARASGSAANGAAP